MSEIIDPHISKKYNIEKKLGKGAYGIVYKAQNKITGKYVAIKKLYDAFQNAIDAQRTYREVMYLKVLDDHDNIIKIYDVYGSLNNRDLYITFELMESDLRIVSKTNILQDHHRCYILYQIFCALKYIHSAGLVHRDIKPANFLINSECRIKLADFGLIRSISKNNKAKHRMLSENVATKWYSAPELLMGSKEYTQSIDIWATGCVMAEIFIGKPLFTGKGSLDQMEAIANVLGKPKTAELKSIGAKNYKEVLRSLSLKQTHSLNVLCKNWSIEAFDLLKKILCYSPTDRLTADQALEHPYFKKIRNIKQERIFTKNINIPFGDFDRLTVNDYRDTLYQMFRENTSKKPPQHSKITLPHIISQSYIPKYTKQVTPNSSQSKHLPFNSIDKSYDKIRSFQQLQYNRALHGKALNQNNTANDFPNHHVDNSKIKTKKLFKLLSNKRSNINIHGIQAKGQTNHFSMNRNKDISFSNFTNSVNKKPIYSNNNLIQNKEFNN